MRSYKSIFFVLRLLTVVAMNFSYAQPSNGAEQNTDALRIDLSTWRKVQAQAKDTVVQIFSYGAQFNWFEPYKSPRQSSGTGSGFFIDDKGHILTNFHAIDQAAAIKIQIPSLGLERFDVEIIGTSPDRDIALLKLTNESLEKVQKELSTISYLKLGDSDTVVRTQEVLSLGYPLGQYKLKSTHGIVSGRERLQSESYIQITAPLNPGNSGGPSLNHEGRVIGINTAGIQEAQNVGYIIPISDVKSVLSRLYTEKVARRPFLGIEMNTASESMARFLDNPVPSGLYIARVYKGTPFKDMNVRAGDVLYEFNGLKIDRFGETRVPWSEDRVSIIDVVNRCDVGQDLDVLVYRNGEKKQVKGKLTVSEELPIRKVYPQFEAVDYEIIGGMVLMSLSLNHAFKLVERIPYFIKYSRRQACYKPKLILAHVIPNSSTHLARSLGEGDIITEVNGMKVGTLHDLRQALAKGVSKDFISIKTEDHKLMVLRVDDIIQEEEMLSAKYLFKKSPMIQLFRDYRSDGLQELQTKFTFNGHPTFPSLFSGSAGLTVRT